MDDSYGWYYLLVVQQTGLGGHMTVQIEVHGSEALSPACQRTSVTTVLTLMQTNWMEAVRPARHLIIMAAVLLIISPILPTSTSLSFSLLSLLYSQMSDHCHGTWHILLSFAFFQLTDLFPSSVLQLPTHSRARVHTSTSLLPLFPW